MNRERRERDGGRKGVEGGRERRGEERREKKRGEGREGERVCVWWHCLYISNRIQDLIDRIWHNPRTMLYWESRCEVT